MNNYERRSAAIALGQAAANRVPIRVYVREGRDAVDVTLAAVGLVRHLDPRRVVLVAGTQRMAVRVDAIVTIDRQDGRRWWPRSPFPPPTTPHDAPMGHPRPVGTIGGDDAS